MKRTVLAFILFGFSIGAQAQAWPAKPIRWVVPYTPAGITDNVTRMVTTELQKSLGQSIVVENKPGANSIVGADAIAKAPPDGYNILTVIAAHAANATLYAGKLPYDPVKSFTPISLAAIAPLILTANNNFPAKNARELIDYAKKNPGKVAFGSSGIGAAAHLTTELLKQTAGIDMLHVPYKGVGNAVTDLLGGQVQVMVAPTQSVMGHVKSGKLRALAVTALKRSTLAPDLPTLDEAGLRGYEIVGWNGLFLPAGSSRAIVSRLHRETVKALAEPDTKTRLTTLGAEGVGSSPDEFKAFVQAEIRKWARVVKAAGLKVE